jgi:hypothetical protein
MTLSCLIWWLLLPLVALLGVVLWASESRSTRINRWRAQGATWQQISDRLGCSRSTARRWASA